MIAEPERLDIANLHQRPFLALFEQNFRERDARPH